MASDNQKAQRRILERMLNDDLNKMIRARSRYTIALNEYDADIPWLKQEESA